MSTVSTDFVALQTALAGEYSIERELGRGGMGIVYLARDVQLDRDVAIKVLPTHFSARRDLRERFLREARTAAGLSHPHIVPIHRVGEAGGFVFFVMSYVPGQTLGERLRVGGPLPSAEVMRIMREVAWALAYAHKHGIVHRDVKPDNILLEEGSGRALVTDFGIAHTEAADHAPSDPGRIMGTARFMSPEQAAGQPVDGRSDLYSLGVVGYLAASGRLPFEAASVPALLVKQATEVPARLALVAPGVAPELGAVVDRCLAMHPDDRLPNGEALADALQPRTEVVRALPVALRSWLRKTNPAQPLFIGMFAIGALALIRSLVVMIVYDFPQGLPNLAGPALLLATPIVPILGFHVTQARRLFKVGYSLGDLREAIARDDAERAEADALEEKLPLTIGQKALRVLTFVSAFQSVGMMLQPFFRPGGVLGAYLIATLVFLAASNAYNVPLMPSAPGRGPRSLRDRLWTSRAGAWVARLLKAPVSSRPIGEAVFRPTEVALGLAASELFAALPTTYRERLAALPGIVERLEIRAAAARTRLAELETLAASASIPAADDDDDRSYARRALGDSVAALEKIRLDLLRLHAGASDLEPLTTLLDAAAALGDDIGRLAEAQDELHFGESGRSLRAESSLTPV